MSVARHVVAIALGGGVLGACAATTGGKAADAQRNRCRFVRIEHNQTESDLAAENVTLTLTVTPGAGKDEDHVTAKVVVQEEDVQSLEARLQQKPNLICEPEPGGGFYRVVLPE